MLENFNYSPFIIFAPHGCDKKGDIRTSIMAECISEIIGAVSFINYDVPRPYVTRNESSSKNEFDYNNIQHVTIYHKGIIDRIEQIAMDLSEIFGRLMFINLHGCMNLWAKRNKDVDVSVGVGFPDRLTSRLSTLHRLCRNLRSNGLSARNANIETRMAAYSQLNMTQAVSMLFKLRNIEADTLQLEVKKQGNRGSDYMARNCAGKIAQALLETYKLEDY